MLRIRHASQLTADIVRYAVVNRMWWIVPLTLTLLVLGLLITAGQAAAPVTLYSMF